MVQLLRHGRLVVQCSGGCSAVAMVYGWQLLTLSCCRSFEIAMLDNRHPVVTAFGPVKKHTTTTRAEDVHLSHTAAAAVGLRQVKPPRTWLLRL